MYENASMAHFIFFALFLIKSPTRKTIPIANQKATFSQFLVWIASITATPKNKMNTVIFVKLIFFIVRFFIYPWGNYKGFGERGNGVGYLSRLGSARRAATTAH
jgi:hypothetical protein